MGKLNYDTVWIHFPGTEAYDEWIKTSHCPASSMEYGNLILDYSFTNKASLPQPAYKHVDRIRGKIVSDLHGSRELLLEIQELINEGVHRDVLIYQRETHPHPSSDPNLVIRRDSRFFVHDGSIDGIFQKVYDAAHTQEKWVTKEFKHLKEFGDRVVKHEGEEPYVCGNHKVHHALEKAVELYKLSQELRSQKPS